MLFFTQHAGDAVTGEADADLLMVGLREVRARKEQIAGKMEAIVGLAFWKGQPVVCVVSVR